MPEVAAISTSIPAKTQPPHGFLRLLGDGPPGPAGPVVIRGTRPLDRGRVVGAAGATACVTDKTPGMDRNTSKSNFTTGMLLGGGATAIFALTFVFAVLYIAN